MAKKKKPDTAFGWLEEVNRIMSAAKHDIGVCVAEAERLKGYEIDFLDENGRSLCATAFNPHWCTHKDERGDMTILINRLPNKVAAIKISQCGK